MEYSVKEKTIEAVLTSTTLETNIEGGKLDVVIGEAAKMDAVQAITFIQSGQVEIQSAVSNGISQFNANAVNKTSDFNTNATNKTSEFNNNYVAKKALIEADVQLAKDWANKTDGTVDGSEYSAKYYAELTATELNNKADKATTLAGYGITDAYTKTEVNGLIPTVNNAILTIQKNGIDIQTFSANASVNATANITVPTDTGDLTNGAGYITSSALSGYATETWVGNQGYITGMAWGGISGTLSDQTDLQSALNGKADIDASNFDATGKSTLANLGMPSGAYENLTFGASGSSYVASKSGYVFLSFNTTATFSYIHLGGSVKTTWLSTLKNVNVLYLFVPVSKGETFTLNYSGVSSNFFRLYYSIGEN